jgi:hypothetical protein
MSQDHALAAGQGGTDLVPAPPAPQSPPAPQAEPTPLPAPQSQDEVKRQSAVDTLAAMLATSMAMLSRCEAQANAARGDRLGPVYAAAQLLHANANIAKALAHVGCVETRHRSIVEKIQPPGSQKAELNSKLPREETAEERETALEELEHRFDRLIEAHRAEQEIMEGLAIGCCI